MRRQNEFATPFFRCLKIIREHKRKHCSQTTGEWLASSVASHGLVRLALDYLKGRKVSAAECKSGLGTDVGAVGGWGAGSISKNGTSYHNYRSPKQFLLIAYLKSSGLNGSMRILCKLGTASLSRF